MIYKFHSLPARPKYLFKHDFIILEFNVKGFIHILRILLVGNFNILVYGRMVKGKGSGRHGGFKFLQLMFFIKLTN